MRFNKLRLTGFKSFVDPTDLLIQDGLTGVVGPNGCGKSNLLEALRWVMGENRAKSMRGSGMEDVIFAGASSRPGRNFAEVALHLDNTDRLAPAGFNESDDLEISRRITRDVGSAFKINAKDVRARDVQMLFADASTGAHSPALVRQGQISELINAKPKSRRRILEEAAGISGLYQRRHEAELKLKSTEANLLRVDDLIEQLAAQLAQLARQARQAARYRAIGEEMRHAEGLLLYRRWKEAEAAHQAAASELRASVTAAARAEAQARAQEQTRENAENAMPTLREEAAIAAAVHQRLQVKRNSLSEQEIAAREKITTLESRVSQLALDIEREVGLNRDAGETIARLDCETRRLDKDGEGFEERIAQASDAAQEAASVLSERESDLGNRTEDAARLAARHQSAQRLLDDSRKLHGRSTQAAEKAKNAVAEAQTHLLRADADAAAAKRAEAAARLKSEQADATLSAADDARAEAQIREGDARAERSEAEGEANALRAEAAALSKLLERDRAEGGQIMDNLKVAHGYEKALGAAFTDDLRAPEVAADGPSGWTLVASPHPVQTLPDGVTPLSRHVSVPDVLERRMTQIGLVSAADGPRLQQLLCPGQRLVSLEGDLWRWDGFRAWAEDIPSTAALRLEQMNRLEKLNHSLAQANQRMTTARDAHDALIARLSDLTRADKEARDARREADRAFNEANRAMNRAENEKTLAEGRLEGFELAARRHEEEARSAALQLREAEGGATGLPDLGAARAMVEDVKLTVEAARMTLMSRRSALDELRREGETRARRSQQIVEEISSWRHRLEIAEKRGAELAERKASNEADLAAAQIVPQTISRQREEIAERIKVAETRRRAAADALAAADTQLRDAVANERDAERAASQARETRAGAQARSDAAALSARQATERIEEDQNVSPDQLLEKLAINPEDIPPADKIEDQVNRLKRQRDGLGAVNLRAEEDAHEVQAEHDTLIAEKSDLEGAVRTLRSGIASLNREGRERLLTAFEQVNRNFSMLFKHLFGGGEANLALVESDDPLEAGLEIMCQPPGKKLSTLSLLSGGEQTLTALALIFAVFLANPAPICVLDEVDAPLDDANVTRFCDLLDEMCRQTDTRFLIITHHAVTMARMDRLFGVTMREQGVSQLVSVDLKKAEKLVA